MRIFWKNSGVSRGAPLLHFRDGHCHSGGFCPRDFSRDSPLDIIPLLPARPALAEKGIPDLGPHGGLGEIEGGRVRSVRSLPRFSPERMVKYSMATVSVPEMGRPSTGTRGCCQIRIPGRSFQRLVGNIGNRSFHRNILSWGRLSPGTPRR